MSEGATQLPPPGTIESGALSEPESQRVTFLLNYLKENSYAYDSHVELIGLLHKGFIAHSTPSADATNGQQRRDPHDYGLLPALRQAREAMDTRFAVGEDNWDEWLSDEILLATTSEERIAVTELFQKAVQDEPASVKLWQMYAGWVWFNYIACSSKDSSESSGWTEEDKAMCRELFTRDLIISALEQAIASTQWRVDESHVVWNRYAELVQEDFPATPSGKEIERLRNMYVARLQFPHATWEETSQMFWSIVSKYEGSNWESIMGEVQALTGPAKTQMSQRESHEQNLARAIESGRREEIFNQFSQYLQWERKREWKQRGRSAFDRELRSALYERALLKFPTQTEWWIDYVDFVIGSDSSTPVLPLIERATRHCPWSGDLWARRILQSDVEGKSHGEIEATKHRATNSGLLDAGGMEEMVKVLQQWCSYLRRHAFNSTGSEDDLDTAEVGITMALEDIQQAGARIYGEDFQGDPLFRLEAIQIKFLSEARRFEDARKIYQGMVKHRRNSFAFWSAFYTWEIMIWGCDIIRHSPRIETAENGPNRATAVLQEALSQRDLDDPDKLVHMYLNHFQQHESGERLRSALVDAREFSKHLAFKRAAEMPAAVEPMPVPPPPPQTSDSKALLHADGAEGAKRKRDDEPMLNGHAEKRTKVEDAPGAVAMDVQNATVDQQPIQESSEPANVPLKRDREHNTITVKDLAADVQELDIKKFFRDVGVPLSINILTDKSGNTATATVEFETPEDVLTAKTRNGKQLKGREVKIQGGGQSTLYVANYPPEYDESSMRKLFDGYGEIASIRFPSLKYNARRRFCYVQFLTSEMARAAETAMDNKMLDGLHKLVAKVSDPDAKKQRSGAQAEGRELFVKNLDRDASEEEIKTFFEGYGIVANMNVVKLVNGKKTGTAFIVFATVEDATAAIKADSKPFRGRILHVELATAKGRAAPMDRARKEDFIISQGAASTSPEPSAMESFGPLVKIQMRRQDRGAIVEFADVKAAFRVRQGVDCSSLGEEVKTGEVGDLLAKVKKRQDGGAAPTSTTGSLVAPTICRPAQRGGRRDGLGFRRGGAVGLGGGTANSTPAKDGKSNADFRNIFEKGKEVVDGPVEKTGDVDAEET